MRSLSVKLGVILIGLVIFGYTEVWGANWKLCISTDYLTAYYDIESLIRTSNGIVKFWYKIIHTEKSAADMVKDFSEPYKTPPSYTITLTEIHCSEKKYRLLDSSNYSADGLILFSSKNPNQEWIFIRPDSPAEEFFKAVCK